MSAGLAARLQLATQLGLDQQIGQLRQSGAGNGTDIVQSGTANALRLLDQTGGANSLRLRMAGERNTTLWTIVEAALRQYIEGQAQAHRPLRRHTFRGRGLQAGLSEGDWTAIRERAYEGRGG